MKNVFSLKVYIKTSLKIKRNKQALKAISSQIKNKTFKRKQMSLFFSINLLLFFASLLSILSDMSISMNVYLNTYYSYSAINTKYIGKPSEIYIGSDKIQTKENFRYEYKNDYYLYIRKTDYTGYYNIKLVWKSEISMNEIPIPTTEVIQEKIPTTVIETEVIDSTDVSTNDLSDLRLTDKIFEVKTDEIYDIIPKNFTLNASQMFYNCGNIRYIDFSDFDTTLIYNMSYMFYYCTSLIEIKNLSPVNVQNMSRAFYHCYSLTKIDFIFPESMNSSQITDMRYTFCYCERLTSINLTHINTKNVTSMRGLFDYCYNLQTIIFDEDFDTSSVTDMRYMFYDCRSLRSLDLSYANFDVSLVTDMGYMFYD